MEEKGSGCIGDTYSGVDASAALGAAKRGRGRGGVAKRGALPKGAAAAR